VYTLSQSGKPLAFVAFLLIAALACGWTARSKGRNIVAWAVLGAMFPLLAWFTLLSLKDKKASAW
jgi:hypothetical protein